MIIIFKAQHIFEYVNMRFYLEIRTNYNLTLDHIRLDTHSSHASTETVSSPNDVETLILLNFY